MPAFSLMLHSPLAKTTEIVKQRYNMEIVSFCGNAHDTEMHWFKET